MTTFDAGTAAGKLTLDTSPYLRALKDAQAQSRALFAQINAGSTALNAGGSTRGGGSVAPQIRDTAQAAAQAEKDTLRYANSLAAAQRAQGDLAGAAQTYRTALSQITPNTIEANRATASLARAERDLENSSRGSATSLGGLNQALTVLGGIGAAAGIARATGELVQLGAQTEQTRARFDQLAQQAGTTGDAFLAALRQGSGGTISDTNLQLAAMKANLLGVADSAAELAPLLAIARDRAQQMGISTEFAFDSIVTGLGRGSKLILDNVGVIVSAEQANERYAQSLGRTVASLTEEEKKQALVNEVLRQGQATIAATGGALDLTNTKIERLNANLDNLKARAGVGLADVFSPAIEGAARLTGSAEEQRQAFESLRQSQGTFLGGLVTSIPVFGQLVGAGQNAAQSMHQLGLDTNLQAQAALQSADATQAQTQAQLQLTPALGDGRRESIVAAETGALARQQQLIAELGGAVAAGLITAADAARILEVQYGETANRALQLINTQAAIAGQNAKALADQRAGERSGGELRTKAEADSLGRLNQLRGDYARRRAADNERAAREAEALARRQETAGRKAANAAAKEANALFRADLDTATTAQERIAVLEEKRRGLEAKGLQNSAAYRQVLADIADEQTKVADEVERANRARVDFELGSVKDQQQDIKDARERAGIERALASSRFSEDQKNVQRLRLQEIALEDQKRALDNARDARAAGLAGPGGAVTTPVQTGAAVPVGTTAPVFAQAPTLEGAGAASTLNLTVEINIDDDRNVTVQPVPGVNLQTIINKGLSRASG